MFQDLLISITGTKSIYIENYKNILDYRDDMILIQGNKETLKLWGNGFQIEYFTSESMRIKGKISKIEYVEKAKTSGRR